MAKRRKRGRRPEELGAPVIESIFVAPSAPGSLGVPGGDGGYLGGGSLGGPRRRRGGKGKGRGKGGGGGGGQFEGGGYGGGGRGRGGGYGGGGVPPVPGPATNPTPVPIGTIKGVVVKPKGKKGRRR